MITYLASDTLHGRSPATNDEILAANFIKNEFSVKKVNIQFQKFPFENDSALNILAYKNNRKDSTIIICAHYDHLGFGSNKSKEILKIGIHPGADDNASGVAMMLELGKYLAKQKRYPYNLLFIGFSGHESGLYGSSYFSNSAYFKNMRCRAVINFDMVGRLDKISPTVRVSGIHTDPVFTQFFSKLFEHAILYRPDDTNIGQSDLREFAKLKIPVLNITTGVHDDYHKISDTEDKINYEGMKKIYDEMLRLLKYLASN